MFGNYFTHDGPYLKTLLMQTIWGVLFQRKEDTFDNCFNTRIDKDIKLTLNIQDRHSLW